RTSLIYSPISSVLRRFSMLSLTFCSWPARVWMTNHWLCMKSLYYRFANSTMFSTQNQSYEIRHHEIDADGKPAEQGQGNHHHNGRAFEFVDRRPGAFFQFFPCLDDVGRYAQQVTFAPQEHENGADD